MSNAVIKQAFETMLDAWATARNPSLPVAYPNAGFTPPANKEPLDNLYLAAFHIPARTSSEDLAGETSTFTGLFQINVVSPRGIGAGPAGKIVEELFALFPVNFQIISGGLTIVTTSPLDDGPGIPADKTYTIPTSFTYRADR